MCFDLPDTPLNTNGRSAMAVARDIAEEGRDTRGESLHQCKNVIFNVHGKIDADVDIDAN